MITVTMMPMVMMIVVLMIGIIMVEADGSIGPASGTLEVSWASSLLRHINALAAGLNMAAIHK